MSNGIILIDYRAVSIRGDIVACSYDLVPCSCSVIVHLPQMTMLVQVRGSLGMGRRSGGSARRRV